MKRAPQAIAGGVLATLLAACGSAPVSYGGDPYYARPSNTSGYYYRDPNAANTPYGDDWRVVSIEVIPGGAHSGTSGAGAVIGGIAGGVLGHQIGSGRGNTAATAAGAIGGAVVGNEVERNRRTTDAYRVTVQGPNGNTETYVMDSLGAMRVGDRVRVANGTIYPLG